MKIIVPVKRVVDFNSKIRPTPGGETVDITFAKRVLNPFCEVAVEEAVRIKEKIHDCEVIVVSIGPAKTQDQLRTALALGADRAILIETDQELEPLLVAKCLKKLFDREMPDLFILGKQSTDSGNSQVGQMLAALCGIAQGSCCSQVELKEGVVSVVREVDGGTEALELQLPALVTADLRLNAPRYASLPNLMKAKKKPLEIIAFTDWGVDYHNRVKQLGVRLPPERKPGVRVANVIELVEKLRNEAKVIL